MTPYLAASISVAPVATGTPLAVVSTALHDREWWAEKRPQQAPTGRAWSPPRSRCWSPAGILERSRRRGGRRAEDWASSQAATPPWRGRQKYRRASPKNEIAPDRLARLRRLIAGDISLERAHARHSNRIRRPPKATLTRR